MTTASAPSCFEPLVIRASAGTGKTYRLSQRFLELLGAGVPCDRILATTFTRKAAGEIQARVLGKLAAAALGDSEALAMVPGLVPHRAQAILGEVVRGLHRLNIGTLDSFFIRIAHAFALELGLPIAWTVLEDSQDQRLRDDALRAMLDEEDPRRIIDLVRLLNNGQARRSVHEKILTVVGKLYDIFQQQPEVAAWNWLDPPSRVAGDRLQAAIDTVAALESELPANKDGSPSKPWLNALRKNVEQARAGEWGAFIGGGLAKSIGLREETFSRKAIPRSFQEKYAPLIRQARAVLLGALASQTHATHQLLDAFDRRYRRLKFYAAALRFSDVTHGLAHGAIEGRLDDLYYRLDASIEHLLLDEFQDTSLPQWQVLRPIAEQVVATERRSFFCVGDVKQAIYGWRGGKAEIFDAMGSLGPQLRFEALDITHRCRPAVLHAVNRVFGSLATNAALESYPEAAKDWGDVFLPHRGTKEDSPGLVRVLTALAANETQDQRAVTLACAAEVVRRLVAQSPGRTVGVLVNTNLAVARMIYELRERGVAASEEGGNPLSDSPGVSIVLSLLRMADHPGDTAARFHVCTSPLGPIVGLTRHDDDAEAVRVAAAVRRELMDLGYGPTLDRWTREVAPSCDARSLTRLTQLVELAHRYDPRATLRTCDFVRVVEREKVADPSAGDVRVMTVFQAKGLEFDIVVLPELEKQLVRLQDELVLTHHDDPAGVPSRIVRYADESLREQDLMLGPMYEQAEQGKLREALCVLYVMMTRARYALHMMLAPSKATEKSIHKTFAGLLRSALIGDDPIEPRKELFSHGDREWYKKLTAPTCVPAMPTAEPTPRLAPLDPNQRRTIRTASPSSFEGGARVDPAQLLRLDRAESRERGIETHARLEQIEWLTPSDRPDPLLASPALRGILSRSAYPTDATVRVLREEAFALRLDGMLLGGTFDRLVLVERDGRVVAAEVIDFKTDTVIGEAVGARAEYYRPQVQAYRRAAATLYGLPEKAVTAKLVFLSPGVVVEVV